MAAYFASSGVIRAKSAREIVRIPLGRAAELRYGCTKSSSKRLLKAAEDLLSEIPVLPFDVPADAEYGGIRSELEAAGRPIGSNDLLIASALKIPLKFLLSNGLMYIVGH